MWAMGRAQKKLHPRIPAISIISRARTALLSMLQTEVGFVEKHDGDKMQTSALLQIHYQLLL